MRDTFSGIAVAMLSLAVCASTACSSDDDNKTSSTTSTSGTGGKTGTGGSGAGGGMTMAGVKPPARPSGAGPGDGPGVVLAISKLDWGVSSPSAWKKFGYDLDGKISTKASMDLCKPAVGAAESSVYPDGDNGIDNSFGRLVMPVMTGLDFEIQDHADKAISGGEHTLLFDLAGLGTNSDYDPIAGKVHNGGNLGTQPAFDGNDEWPYFGETAFANGYVSNNTWVSAPAGTINLRMDFASEHLPVPISNAVVTMELAGDRKSATNGVIAGIVAVDDYIKILRKVVGLFDPGLCSGATFDSLADQIRQAADILIDGSQDPAKTCDGISIGVGFEAKVVQLGSSVAPPTQEDPCAGGNGN